MGARCDKCGYIWPNLETTDTCYPHHNKVTVVYQSEFNTDWAKEIGETPFVRDSKGELHKRGVMDAL